VDTQQARVSNESSKRMILFSLLISSCIISCGIDTINYLSEDPVSISSDGTSSFIFSIINTGSTNYLGVQLFYRIYASSSDADSDKSYITAKQGETNFVPGALIESYLISPNGLKYLSPLINNEIRFPSIVKSVVNDENDYINLSYPGTEEPSFFVDSAASTRYVLKRNVLDSSNHYKSFLDIPITGDADYRSNSSDDDDTYYVQFYSSAYGTSSADLLDLYGNAIYLGRVTLNF
jgi:hypothetical protein